MKALLVLTTILMATAPAFGMEKCKIQMPDITKDAITVTGATRDEAQANAAIKCFDMHEEMSQRRNGRGLANDDQGVTIVNACTNIRCG